jgi:hypothetical protein
MSMEPFQKVMEVTNLHGEAEQSDRNYWSSRSPEERLRAIEIHREIAYGKSNTTQRVQRILEVVERT